MERHENGLHVCASIVIIINVCTLLAIYKFQGTTPILTLPNFKSLTSTSCLVWWDQLFTFHDHQLCSWMGWRPPKFPKRKYLFPISHHLHYPKPVNCWGRVVLRIPNPHHQSCPIPLWIPHPRVYLPIFSASCPIHPFSKLLSYWAKLAAQSRLLSYAGTLPSWKVLSNETRTGCCCLLVGGWARFFFIDPGKLTAGTRKWRWMEEKDFPCEFGDL